MDYLLIISIDDNNVGGGGDEEVDKPSFVPVRYIVAAMTLLAALDLYNSRFNLSVAMVAMSSFNRTRAATTAESDVCVNNGQPIDSVQSHQTDGEFDWDPHTQQVIVYSFFYGYILFHVVGARLAERFGAKWLCAVSIVVSIVINVCTPMIVRSHAYWLLLASRVVLGVGQSLMFPACYALFAKWVPDYERSVILSFPLIGSNIGTIITSSLSKYLTEHGFAGGWPSAFYVPALIAGVWLLCWVVTIKSEPKDHPWISSHELNHIRTYNSHHKHHGHHHHKHQSVPWLQVLTSMPVLATVVVKFAVNWIFILITFKMPSYLQTVFDYSSAQGVFLFGMHSGGDIPVIADMTTKYMATVYALCETVALTCAILTPLTIDWLIDTDELHVRQQWSYMFYGSGAMAVVGGLVFAAFGSAERQEWDKNNANSDTNNGIYLHRI
ncbi:unnamed protein product [Medioppia subpectinata]|uniref:Major facilitator superfamily (MFS) profile domain-containing protein n=1 Tax=Medioppia subpectinata TaxID=1979941 RepID=A0A7R9PZT4_9ACAR|nr:unnamed protein product [Medioppia subpectinata]CAG2107353.1 unnamed protein product [Medioppia subpectinata]